MKYNQAIATISARWNIHICIWPQFCMVHSAIIWAIQAFATSMTMYWRHRPYFSEWMKVIATIHAQIYCVFADGCVYANFSRTTLTTAQQQPTTIQNNYRIFQVFFFCIDKIKCSCFCLFLFFLSFFLLLLNQKQILLLTVSVFYTW